MAGSSSARLASLRMLLLLLGVMGTWMAVLVLRPCRDLLRAQGDLMQQGLGVLLLLLLLGIVVVVLVRREQQQLVVVVGLVLLQVQIQWAQ